MLYFSEKIRNFPQASYLERFQFSSVSYHLIHYIQNISFKDTNKPIKLTTIQGNITTIGVFYPSWPPYIYATGNMSLYLKLFFFCPCPLLQKRSDQVEFILKNPGEIHFNTTKSTNMILEHGNNYQPTTRIQGGYLSAFLKIISTN